MSKIIKFEIAKKTDNSQFEFICGCGSNKFNIVFYGGKKIYAQCTECESYHSSDEIFMVFES